MTRSTDLAALPRGRSARSVDGSIYGSTAVTVQNEAGTMTPGPLV